MLTIEDRDKAAAALEEAAANGTKLATGVPIQYFLDDTIAVCSCVVAAQALGWKLPEYPDQGRDVYDFLNERGFLTYPIYSANDDLTDFDEERNIYAPGGFAAAAKVVRAMEAV